MSEIAIGGTPARNRPDYWAAGADGGHPWAAISDLRSRFVSTTKERITDLGVRNSNVKPVAPGTVLMSFKLTIGRTAIATVPLYTNEAIAAFRPQPLLDSGFLFYALPAASDAGEADVAVKGRTLNKAKLLDLPLLLPPLPEQRKIAAILSSVDETIEKTEAVIQQLDVVKKAMLEELLTRGIPGRHSRFKMTEIGEVPEEWAVATIDQVATMVGSGVTPRGGERSYTRDGVMLIRSQNVHFGGLRLEDVARIPSSVHREMERSEVRPGDVLLNITGASIGRVCSVPGTIGQANVNQHVCIIRLPPERAVPNFVASFLAADRGQNQINALQAGLSRQALNYQQVRAIRLPLPTVQEQEDIGRALASIDSHVDALSDELHALRGLKSAVAAALLSGELRVHLGAGAA